MGSELSTARPQPLCSGRHARPEDFESGLVTLGLTKTKEAPHVAPHVALLQRTAGERRCRVFGVRSVFERGEDERR